MSLSNLIIRLMKGNWARVLGLGTNLDHPSAEGWLGDMPAKQLRKYHFSGTFCVAHLFELVESLAWESTKLARVSNTY